MLIYPNTAPHGLKDLVLSAAIALPVPTPDRFSFTSLLTGGTFRPDPARPHFGVCISVTVCLCPHAVWLSWSGGMPRCTLSGWLSLPCGPDFGWLSLAGSLWLALSSWLSLAGSLWLALSGWLSLAGTCYD